jgi:hypothetical protein
VTNSHLPRRLVSGLIRMGGSFVHVSPGLGTSKYAPFRFLCPPEATLLELRRAPGGRARRRRTLGRSRSREGFQRPDAASSNAASYPATMASLENRR